MTTTAHRALTPVDITRQSPSRRTGQLQAWQAVSRCGTWMYGRVEDTRDDWETWHKPTGLRAGLHGSLDAARAATGDGTALADVDLQLAHGRGDHAAARDPGCARC